MKLSKQTTRLLESPLAELSQNLQATTEQEERQAVEELDALLTRAARVRAYIDYRVLHRGNPVLNNVPLAHARAVDQSNRVARQVRKALGYNVRADLNF
jgi:hypothetical protein